MAVIFSIVQFSFLIMMFDVRKAALPASEGRQGVYLLQLSLSPRMAVWVLAASMTA